jgi:hypothetical protein
MDKEIIELNITLTELITLRDSQERDSEEWNQTVNDIALQIWLSYLPDKAVTSYGYLTAVNDRDDYRARLWPRILRASAKVRSDTAAAPTTFFYNVLRWECSHTNVKDRYQVSVPQRIVTNETLRPTEASLDATPAGHEGESMGLAHTLRDENVKPAYDALEGFERAKLCFELCEELYAKVTDTDRVIIDGLAKGKMGKDIAIEMGVSRQAVSHRLKVIRRQYHGIKCQYDRINQ